MKKRRGKYQEHEVYEEAILQANMECERQKKRSAWPFEMLAINLTASARFNFWATVAGDEKLLSRMTGSRVKIARALKLVRRELQSSIAEVARMLTHRILFLFDLII